MSIYASEEFLKTVGDKYGWVAGYNTDGELRLILPYTLIKKFIFNMVRFRVETIPITVEFTDKEEKVFLNSVVKYFRDIWVLT